MRLTGIIRDRGCLTEVSNISFHSNRARYYDAKFGIRRNVFTTFIQMYSALVVLVFFLFFCILAGHREEIPTFHIHRDADHVCSFESSFPPKKVNKYTFSLSPIVLDV